MPSSGSQEGKFLPINLTFGEQRGLYILGDRGSLEVLRDLIDHALTDENGLAMIVSNYTAFNIERLRVQVAAPTPEQEEGR